MTARLAETARLLVQNAADADSRCVIGAHAEIRNYPGKGVALSGKGGGQTVARLGPPDQYASTSLHAYLAPVASGKLWAWYVADAGSTNGTWLTHAGEQEFRVTVPALIEAGDRLRVGRTVMILVPV